MCCAVQATMRSFKKQMCLNSILDLGFSVQQAQVRAICSGHSSSSQTAAAAAAAAMGAQDSLAGRYDGPCCCHLGVDSSKCLAAASPAQ